jgi:RIO-like serine/threonine protein kinase
MGEMKKMRGQIYGGHKWETLDGILVLLRDSHWHPVKEIEEAIWLPEEKLVDILGFFSDFDLINYVDGKSRVKIKPLGLSVLRLPTEK